MERNQTFEVDFIPRKSRGKEKHLIIYARITVDGERAEFSTNEKIGPKDWDKAKGAVKGNGLKAKEANESLDCIKHKLRSKYRILKETESLITAEAVKNEYLGIYSSLKGHTLGELIQYYKKIYEGKLKEGGFKNYRTTIRYTELFLAFKYPVKKDLYLSQIDNEFLTEFEHYIRTNPLKEHDPCLGNGLGKHIQRFKRFINWATDELKWSKQNQIAKYKCPIKKTKRKKLTFEHLVVLEKKLFLDPSLNYIKDIFLFSCYTGFAFTDVMALNEAHFEWHGDETVWCKLYRTKSEILSPIPLIKDASQLLTTYRLRDADQSRGTIFKRLTNQYVNRGLKIISEACEIPFKLTFHIARHTFATTVAIKNGIPIETVQLMMGHTKISTTLIYVEVDEEKIENDMAGIEQKMEKRRERVIEKLNALRVSLSA